MSDYADLAMKKRAVLTEEGRPACNCCQAVASVFARDAGYDEGTAMRAAAFFRGGLQMGSACGALSGAALALGLAGVTDPGALDGICRRMKEKTGGMTDCRDLLRASAERGEVKKVHCDGLIRAVVGWTEEALREAGKIP